MQRLAVGEELALVGEVEAAPQLEAAGTGPTVDQVGVGQHADDLERGVAKERLASWVEHQHDAARVDQDDAVDSGVDDGP